MHTLTFAPITADNWRAVTRLTLKPGQERYIYPNWYTILQGIFEGHPTYAIYDGDTLVGLTIYGTIRHEGEGWTIDGHEIIRIMIDADQQGRGYGRAVLTEIIARLRADPACHTLYIRFAPDNAVARHLYTSLGFADTGHTIKGELMFAMPGKL